MSDASDLLIKIRTILEGAENIETAKKGLKELVDAEKTGSAETAKSKIEMEKFHRALAPTRAGLSSLAAFMRGDMVQGFNALSVAARTAFSTIGTGALGASVGLATWKLGSIIDETLGLSDAIANALSPSLENIQGTARMTGEEFLKWQKIDFDLFKENLDGVAESAKKVYDRIQKIADLNKELDQSEIDSKIAAIEATEAPGPARDRKIADLNMQKGLEAVAAARSKSNTELERETAVLAELQKKSAAASAEASVAKELWEGDATRMIRLVKSQDPQGHAAGAAGMAYYRNWIDTSEKNATAAKLALLRQEEKVKDLNQENDLINRKASRDAEAIRSKRIKRENEIVADEGKKQDEAALVDLKREITTARARLKTGLAAAEREQNESKAAFAAHDELERTGMVNGRRYSRQSPVYQQAHDEAVTRAEKEAQEAFMAVQRLDAANSRMAQFIQSLVEKQETLAAQLRNHPSNS
jgi:hypothetical protein